MFWMHPFSPISVGAWYWVLTPRGRRFIEQATSKDHFASGYTGCAIAGPIPVPPEPFKAAYDLSGAA